MKCPKCQAEMVSVSFGEYEVDRCTKCGGLWFDTLEQEHLRAVRGSQAIDTGSPAVGKRMDQIRDIQCPRCTAMLVKMTDVHHPRLHYEMCSTCGGTFFDAGEFKDYKHETIGELVQRLLSPGKR